MDFLFLFLTDYRLPITDNRLLVVLAANESVQNRSRKDAANSGSNQAPSFGGKDFLVED